MAVNIRDPQTMPEWLHDSGRRIGIATGMQKAFIETTSALLW
jgi:hypothetical protein